MFYYVICTKMNTVIVETLRKYITHVIGNLGCLSLKDDNGDNVVFIAMLTHMNKTLPYAAHRHNWTIVEDIFTHLCRIAENFEYLVDNKCYEEAIMLILCDADYIEKCFKKWALVVHNVEYECFHIFD